MPNVVASGSNRPRTASALVSDVARSVGKEDNGTSRAEALGYLNDVINELNMHQPWEALRTELTSQSFTASTATYSLGTAVYRVESVWITDANGNHAWTVGEFDYAQFKEFDPTRVSDFARYFILRNPHADGLIEFVGKPGATTPTEKWNVAYIKRIPLLEGENEILDIPREFDRLLVEGAKYYMRDNSATADTQTTIRTFQNYQRLLRAMKSNDRRHPAQHPRFRIATQSTPTGTILIRV